MFKFLKNKQNIQSAFAFLMIWIVIFSLILYLFDDSSVQLEKLEQIDQGYTELVEQLDLLEKAIDASQKLQSERADTLLEYNETLLTRLELDKEIFIVLERRIASIQEALNISDLNSTGLTYVQTEVADVLQSLKRINETETTELTESISKQSNSIETE